MALSPRDQSKWDSLQDQGSSAIDSILAGKGTDKDIKELSRILNEQHELAGQIFDQGMLDSENTASTIVDAMNKKRIDEGKKPLTQKAFDRVFQSTLQQVMSQSIEDILGQIQDEFENSEREIKNKIDKALEKIRNFSGAPVTPQSSEGSPQQPRSLFDRFTQQPTTENRQESSSERSLMDRIMRRNAESERQRTSVLQLIKDAASSVKNKAADLYGRFRSRSGEEDEDKKASVWMRKLRALFDPVGRALKKMKSGGSKLGNLLSMIGKPLLLALMNPQLIRSITDAVSKYLNFDTISKFISDTWDSTKKLGSESITWIVDKVKGFFGFGSDKKKAATPVKRADPLERKLHTGALPKSITPSQAQSVLPNYQTQLTNAKQQLTQAQAAYAQNPSATNKKAVEDAQRNVNFYQTRVTQYQARASEGKTAGSSVEQAQTLVSPSTTPTSTDSAGAPTATTVNSVAPSTVVGSSSVAAPVTTVVADTPKFEPGKAFTPPGTMDEVEKPIDKTGAATSQISIGSFGFDSNDSALNILNLGMLA